MTRGWTAADIPDLTGKLAVVTGANSGIGLETTRELARHGATVILACRSRERAEPAIAELHASLPELPAGRLEFRPLDLASLESIREFAGRLSADHSVVDLLINNAGVMALPYGETADGIEMQMGTNHLGHFALTGRLLPLVLAAPSGRVVTVASVMHRIGNLGLNPTYPSPSRRYRKWSAYGDSKLANLLFTYELQRRFERAGARAIALASHPGYASTNLPRVGPKMRGARVFDGLVVLGNHVIAQSAAMGAWPSLYAATGPGLRGGEFIGPDGLLGWRGHPRVVRSSRGSHDLQAAEALWANSIARTQVEFAL